MKNIFLLMLMAIALLTACNDTKIEFDDVPEDVEVAFTTSFEEGSSNQELKTTITTGHDRGTAPVYLSGINITGKNSIYASDYDYTFMFADKADAGNPITMEVKTGSTTFKAEGLAANLMPHKLDGDGNMVLVGYPGMHHHFYWSGNYPTNDLGHLIPDTVTYPYSDLAARAEQYSKMILELYPLHAIYTSDEETVDVRFGVTNKVDLKLEPQNGRTDFVVEQNFDVAQHLDIRFRAWLLDATNEPIVDPTNNGTPITHNGIQSWITCASAWVLNHESMVAGTKVAIDVSKRATEGASALDWYIIHTDTINVVAGKHSTYLIKFSGSVYTECGESTMTFEPFTENNEYTLY